MPTIKKILCPVDFFPHSDAAVQYAADLATQFGATIHLVHVVMHVMPAAYEYPLNTSDVIRSVEDASKREMNKLVARLKKRNVKVTSEVRTGHIHEVLKRVISTVKPDLVVTANHGRSGLERFFMGSVTEWLTRNSTVPVLAVPIDTKAKPARRKARPAKRAA
ncbi:MAG TPA: universal stress protein [Terriglobia bacterium]|nr:universal stress protein [Terriglobia bacterium]